MVFPKKHQSKNNAVFELIAQYCRLFQRKLTVPMPVPKVVFKPHVPVF